MNIPQNTSKPGNESGFTLVELLIVMSVILILMTLAIPAMQQVIRKGNETSAISSLRMLNEMEGQYASQYPQHGFACSLPALGGKVGSAPPQRRGRTAHQRRPRQRQQVRLHLHHHRLQQDHG